MSASYRNGASLQEVYRLVLPRDTRLVWGEHLLQRPVSWAVSMRPSPPAFPRLTGDELALVDMQDLRQLDPRERLERVVELLRRAGAAGLAVRGRVGPRALEAATHAGLPLFRLPEDSGLVQVERDVIRYIVDRQGYVAGLVAELQRDLTRLGLDGKGLAAMAERIHGFIQQPLVFLDEHGRPQAHAGLTEAPTSASTPGQVASSWLEALPNRTALHSLVAGLEPGSPEAIPVSLQRRGDVLAGALRPVWVEGRRVGYCLLLRPQVPGQAPLDLLEMAALDQAADAAALEWSRQHTVDAVRTRMQAAFLDELLATPVADEEAWIQRGRVLGYELDCPHAAWLVDVQGTGEWAEVLHRFAEEQRVAVPMTQRNEGTLLFWPSQHPKSARHLKPLAQALASRLQALDPQVKVLIAIGRPATRPSEWLRSYRQARESWHMGRAWGGSPVSYFGDLGLYQLLTGLGHSGEAVRFFRKTLQPLLEYDAARDGDLVETLEAFFACHGNVSQTAARLHVHRNTLAYRLERIRAITRLDLDDPEARFALQLALKLRPVLEGPRRGPGRSASGPGPT